MPSTKKSFEHSASVRSPTSTIFRQRALSVTIRPFTGRRRPTGTTLTFVTSDPKRRYRNASA